MQMLWLRKTVEAAAGCDLLILNTDQKIAACGSSYKRAILLSGFLLQTLKNRIGAAFVRRDAGVAQFAFQIVAG